MAADFPGFDSDLAVLHKRCIKHGISSPVGPAKNGRPYIKGQVHIDLCEVFNKQMVKSTIFKNRYRTLRLDDVSKALLGHGKFGDGEITGANVADLPIQAQKPYVLQDARLVLELVQVNNGQVIALMKAISELVGLSLERTCHTGLST
jgi:DNA polymerase elongation subunit (family B)